jgi:hypothetical protein
MRRRRQEIMARFPVRDTLEKSELIRRFFPENNEGEVLELLELVEREFRIDVGFLRPDDSLYALFAPIPTRNPLWWMLFRMWESDGVTEISAEVARNGADATAC